MIRSAEALRSSVGRGTSHGGNGGHGDREGWQLGGYQQTFWQAFLNRHRPRTRNLPDWTVIAGIRPPSPEALDGAGDGGADSSIAAGGLGNRRVFWHFGSASLVQLE
jgi:hypothetical protein